MINNFSKKLDFITTQVVEINNAKPLNQRQLLEQLLKIEIQLDEIIEKINQPSQIEKRIEFLIQRSQETLLKIESVLEQINKKL